MQTEWSQSKLALSPPLSEQVLEPLHCALHELVHEPLQVFWSRQASEALAPALTPPSPAPPHWQLAAA